MSQKIIYQNFLLRKLRLGYLQTKFRILRWLPSTKFLSKRIPIFKGSRFTHTSLSWLWETIKAVWDITTTAHTNTSSALRSAAVKEKPGMNLPTRKTNTCDNRKIATPWSGHVLVSVLRSAASSAFMLGKAVLPQEYFWNHLYLTGALKSFIHQGFILASRTH